MAPGRICMAGLVLVASVWMTLVDTTATTSAMPSGIAATRVLALAPTTTTTTTTTTTPSPRLLSSLPSSSPSAVIISSSSSARANPPGHFCLGVLISPSFAVASSECLQFQFQALTHSTTTSLQISSHEGATTTTTTTVSHVVIPSAAIQDGVSYALLKLQQPLQGHAVALLHAGSPSTVATATATIAVQDVEFYVNNLDKDAAVVASTSSKSIPLDSCSTQLASLKKEHKLRADDWLCVDGLQTCQLPKPANKKASTWTSHGFLLSPSRKSKKDDQGQGQDQDQQEILWGIVWNFATSCGGPGGAMESSSTPVQTIAVIRDVVDHFSTNHTWWSPGEEGDDDGHHEQKKDLPPALGSDHQNQSQSSSSSASGGHDASSSSGPPPATGEGSRANSGSGVDEVEEPPAAVVLIPDWLYAAHSMVAYLTPTPNTTRGDGTVGVLITPRHVVVPRIWLQGRDVATFQYATFALETDKQHKILSVISESEFYEQPVNGSIASQVDPREELVVLELEERVSFYVGPITTTPPTVGTEYAKASIMLFDTAMHGSTTQSKEPEVESSLVGSHVARPLLRSSGETEGDDSSESSHGSSHKGDPLEPVAQRLPVLENIQFIHLSECISNGTNSSIGHDDQDLLCAQSLAHRGKSEKETPASEIGLLIEDNHIVGFTVQAHEYDTKFTVSQFSSPMHRAVLDATTATQGEEIQWEQPNDDVFANDADEIAAFPSYLVSLYTDESQPPFAPCKGLLVAQNSVLTTASCLLAQPSNLFTSVGVYNKKDDTERQYPVRDDYQFIHPLYETKDDFLFDIAVIGLTENVESVMPIALNPGYPAWILNATVQQINQPKFFSGGDPGRVEPSSGVVGACGNRTMSSNSSDHHQNTSRPLLPGKSFVRPRGICVTQDRKQSEHFRVYRAPGDPLITKSTTLGGSITAVGLAVMVPWDYGEDEDSSDFGSSASGEWEAEGSATHEENEFLVGATSTFSQDVYMSFADNANFINGYVTGVVWGRSTTSGSNKIPVAMPSYAVGLRITKDGPNFCSGTLISSAYVLTAAHCVHDALVKYVAIGGSDEPSQVEILPVMKGDILLHPSYGKPYQFSNDAAIFELTVAANSYGVALDTTLDYTAKTRAVMYGFGGNAKGHSVELPLYSRAQCKATLPDIDDSMLCAGGEGGKDACQGDSGGPLVVQQEDDSSSEYVVGIVSAGYGCGIAGVPGIYARASNLKSFVESYVVGSRWGRSGQNSATTPGRTTTGSTSTPATTASRSPGSPSATPSASQNETRESSTVDPGEIESYSRGPSQNNTVPTTGGTTTTNTGDGGVYAMPIKSVELPRNTLPRLRVALLAFLMGDYAKFLEDPSSSLKKLMDLTNHIWFHSRGELSGIVSILQRHNENPLYSRKDRFQRGVSVTALFDPATTSAHTCKN